MPRAWSLSVPALDSKWVVDTGMFEATEEVDVKACSGENVQRYDGLQLERVPGKVDIARQRVAACGRYFTALPQAFTAFMELLAKFVAARPGLVCYWTLARKINSRVRRAAWCASNI